jgi:hypothetical protein
VPDSYVKGCTYSSLVKFPGNNLDIRKPFESITKTKLQIFTVPLTDLTEIEFLKLLQLNLKLDTDYTILFQYTLYEQSIHIMLEPQLGIHLRETHDFKIYSLLYEHYLEKL